MNQKIKMVTTKDTCTRALNQKAFEKKYMSMKSLSQLRNLAGMLLLLFWTKFIYIVNQRELREEDYGV